MLRERKRERERERENALSRESPGCRRVPGHLAAGQVVSLPGGAPVPGGLSGGGGGVQAAPAAGGGGVGGGVNPKP